MRRDPVTSEVREAVFDRDVERTSWWNIGPICVAPYLDPDAGRCGGRTTLDHVKDEPMMGKRAPSDAAHLVSVCWHHHLDGWATAHRPLLREYLKGKA